MKLRLPARSAALASIAALTLGSLATLAPISAPAAVAAAVEPCAWSGSSATSLRPTASLPQKISADGLGTVTLTLSCLNDSPVFLTGASVTLREAPRDAAATGRPVVVQLQSDPKTPATPTPNADGTFTATFELPIAEQERFPVAGKVWLDRLWVKIDARTTGGGAAIASTSNTAPGASTPLALPALQTATTTVVAGKHYSPEAQLPGSSSVGEPISVRRQAWGAGAVLSYRWLDANHDVLSTEASFAPTEAQQRVSLETRGEWEDGAVRTSTSNSTLVLPPSPSNGFTTLRTIGDAFPYGDGLGYNEINEAGTSTGIANSNTITGGWYRVNDFGRVEGFSATGSRTPHSVEPILTPPPESLGGRFVYIRKLASEWRATDVVTIRQAPTPDRLETGYAGALVNAHTLKNTALRPGATVTIAKPWRPIVPSTFAWLRDGKTTVSTSASYKLTLADVGHTLQGISRTASPAFAVKEIRSVAFKVSPSVIVAPKLKLNRTTARVEDVLSVTRSGGTASATVSYQWYRGSVAIKGATSSSYKLTTADWGRLVGVTATVSKTGHTRAQARTFLSKDVANGIMKPGTLKLKGTTKVGSKLSVVRGGTRTASAHVQYSWYRNGKRIAGATKSSYKLAKADRGKRVAVRLEVSRVRYTTARVTATSSKIR